ncbi:AAA family ATPase [Pelagibius sp.]|uniref:AAA family ATPase n=1 Tax=Pelagibius sp. TaxID=1931238 RepID=UPI003BB1B9DF
MLRLHITGASGSGTTTLGKALARQLQITHLDTDDFYWLPSEPPFSEARPAAERLRLMNKALVQAANWVLSGSVGGWGSSLTPQFDLVIFLSVPTPVRLARLKARELARFGGDRLAPGGEQHEIHNAFMEWASLYESGPPIGRSREKHERWLEKLPCPVLRLEGEQSRDAQLAECLAALRDHKLRD